MLRLTEFDKLGVRFPATDDQLPKESRYKSIRLKRIEYKVSSDNNYLTGMKLIFTHGFETPMLETKSNKPNIVWPMLYPDHFKPDGVKSEGVSIQLDEDYETIDVD